MLIRLVPGTPASELQETLKLFLARGPDFALTKLWALQAAALSFGNHALQQSRIPRPWSWSFLADLICDRCKCWKSDHTAFCVGREPSELEQSDGDSVWQSSTVTSALLLALASANNPRAIYNAFAFGMGALGNPPALARMKYGRSGDRAKNIVVEEGFDLTMRSMAGHSLQGILSTPSADLGAAFAKARQAASRSERMTVLGVSLVDLDALRRGEEDIHTDEALLSFGHSFVLVISFQGWQIYQAGWRLREHWGETKFSLFQWIQRGGAAAHPFGEASNVFLDAFGVLSRGNQEFTWSADLHEAYYKCFNINFQWIRAEDGNPPLPCAYKPWVRIYEIENVVSEDCQKFRWVGEGDLAPLPS